jgi:hypothetical protein
MSEFKEHTLTELLKLANDAKKMHDDLKEEIISDSKVMDDLNAKINEKIELLSFIEKNYVNIIEELNNRDAI